MHDNKTRSEIGWNPQPLDYEIQDQDQPAERWHEIDGIDIVFMLVALALFIAAIFGAFLTAGGAL